ncbi:MAG: hypothetical protein ABFR05_11175 [Bacteroidota bacterium]
MNKIFILLFLIFILQFFSCKDDAFGTIPSTGNLQFSKDTVFLDTVFTNVSSSTRTLKIYNKSSSNITIPSIKLGRGDNSFYRLNVDGISDGSFENIDILARDSIFVFIEATIDHSKVVNPIYTDSIVFDSGSRQQDVKLVTLVQDAYFLYPQRDVHGVKERIVLGIDGEGDEIAVDGFYLKENTTWTNEKPYVVYGFVGVPEDKTLTIEKGTRIHFHKNSGLLVDKNATLKVNGELGEEVIFEGDRLEPGYSEIPGQWSTVWLRAGSKEHEIKNAIIKNNAIGILMDSIGSLTEPTLRIYNTQIYNTSNFGLLGRTANIKGENLVIANNGMASLACTIGGTYNFIHLTLANFWRSGIRDYPTLLVNNFLKYNDNGTEKLLSRDLKEANFSNCIIDGNKNLELILENSGEADFNYNLKNNLVRFNDVNSKFKDDPLYDFEDTSHYRENILNGNADFKGIQTNQYIIGEESEAINKADKNAALQVPVDILGVDRATNPDIGAYQHIVFEEE